ncbi:MAG: hypothetical protein NTZ28_04960 [Nitrospirae bacterium]|nr:hypothetical protein [Nitrospirota bacterium]
MSHTPSAGTQPTVIEKVFDFVDERVGLKLLTAKMLNEAVPGGSRWAYVFGSVLPPTMPTPVPNTFFMTSTTAGSC